MKILITSNQHKYYDHVGEIVGKESGGWLVEIPDRDGAILTFVKEKDFKSTRDEATFSRATTAKP